VDSLQDRPVQVRYKPEARGVSLLLEENIAEAVEAAAVAS
jgi:hypothetical protein